MWSVISCFQLVCIPSIKLYSQQIPSQQLKEEEQINTQSVNTFVYRTHTCGELTINDINKNVQLCGWLQFKRMEAFIVLRDSYGVTQCIIYKQKLDLLKKLLSLPYESVLKITGIVMPRPKHKCNPNLKTGDVEVKIESYEIFNLAMSKLPFNISNFNEAKEFLQMQYRYLALRYPKLQNNLKIRSWVTMKMREYLINQCGFIDVVTPILFRKTPGGAQEFVVPTKQLGRFYSLTQSPQQFKQLLMVGGIDRYFQIAQCYRDEGSRNDRQPEFTQLDIEMSFVDQENIINLTEKLIENSWPKFLEPLQIPFERLSYEEALEIYGTDCPDLRIPGRIYNISKMIGKDLNKPYEVYVTVFPQKKQFLTKSVQEQFINLSTQIFKNATLIQLGISDLKLEILKDLFSKSSREKITNFFNLKKNDVLLLTYGLKAEARQLLGKIRVDFTNVIESAGEAIRSCVFKFVWIFDFPLFAINNKTKVMEISHHPFTQPHPDDLKYLCTDPLKVRGLQYDLVINGSEIGGGSIRIHQKDLQKEILKMLNIDSSEMFYLLEALDSGAPPHGGIAIGLDRYISIICKASSIREVIAFPKTIDGCDLMSGAPTLISEADKKLYHIETVDNNTVTKVAVV
ncbi:PREDICTED: aspartate--tRNA ligase, mitochondrial [Ceratosolen solmsi marchali]|uniref:Aspartate--tRNA ligase, mitochondrial n=1 Tax=Ceratosolen solmsi marchali TaxID=326594 RepID=A0AAJ6YQL5_9HYME|nr:PREDICTED: aspartate--tRNA ligase, mitochondrial [Ceratosolen solmsi marchali]